VSERPATPFEKVYAFEPGQEHKADVAVGVPLTLMFQVGEVINYQTHGDRAVLPPGYEQPPWDIKQGAFGMPETPVLFVTVTSPGLTNGLVVTTNKRVYLIQLRSVARSRVRLVRWTYADEPVLPVQAKVKPRLLPDPTLPQSYHVGYTVESSEPRPTWLPRQVVDDGRGFCRKFHWGHIWGMLSRRDDPGQPEGERRWRSALRGPISRRTSF
jgi:type IV secretory pathway VirB9-like protein